ncbi:hypothetical protein JCGZ_15489 [Jatropha curcas]|uniref:Uncharacterized protein n=1 Tax=Jatropha curcas TaxID=180498 RepID=A0A067K3V2_JATCU|nr:hypothetical protein JCGZ_15489 [Jatropha curcas]
MTPEDLLEEYDGSPADIPLMAGDYASYFSTRLQARLPEDRRRHRTPAYYKAQAEAEAEANASAGPTGAILGDAGSSTATAGSLACRTRACLEIPGVIPEVWLCPVIHRPVDLEIGRLRRHQSRQFGAVTRLQMEVDRLRTRLEVEGIPLDFSEDEEDDDDGSSSDDAPPPPPS